MPDVLIMTEQYLKENGVINGNSDMGIITPTIVLVQDKYIHPILGTDLYTEIETQINSSTVGTRDQVSSANQTLLDKYILKTMLWYILMEATPLFKYRYMNKGVMVKSSDNSSAADLSEIQYNMNRWQQDAEMYAERTTKFLKANTTTYPLYLQNNDCDDIRPNKTNYTSSIYLPSSEWDDDDYKTSIGNY
jgi:hypothetical protein